MLIAILPKGHEQYLNEARPEIALSDDEGILFLSKLGQELGKNRLTCLIRDYVEAGKVGKKGACHLFRHTMATLMLENGADIRFIQAMLGHVEFSTTEIYTQVSIKKLKEVHTLTHPEKATRTKTKAIMEEPVLTEEDLFTALAAEEKEDSEEE